MRQSPRFWLKVLIFFLFINIYNLWCACLFEWACFCVWGVYAHLCAGMLCVPLCVCGYKTICRGVVVATALPYCMLLMYQALTMSFSLTHFHHFSESSQPLVKEAILPPFYRLKKKKIHRGLESLSGFA